MQFPHESAFNIVRTHQEVVGLSKEGTLTLLGNNYFIFHAGGAGGPEVQKLRAHYMDGPLHYYTGMLLPSFS